MAYAKGNVFFWWPDENGVAPKPGEAPSMFVNFKINYHNNDLDLGEPEMLLSTESSEFPRIDDRVALKRHSWVFLSLEDMNAGTDFACIGPRMGGEWQFTNPRFSFIRSRLLIKLLR